MSFRINLFWWPVLLIVSPLLVPLLAAKNNRFAANRLKAEKQNQLRFEKARPLDLPDLEFLRLTVLVEEKAENGFLGDSGVSYLFTNEQGSLLYDLVYGPDRPSLGHNAAKLGITLDQIDAVAISHLHPDHMGGVKAARQKCVMASEILGQPNGMPCFVSVHAEAQGFNVDVVDGPRALAAGLTSTGPMARSLFFFGYTEEQAIVARIQGKGLVVFTGCGHPTAEVVLKMAQLLYHEPIYAFSGGLHFPISAGWGNKLSIQFQRIFGTGKPPWQTINDDDLSGTIQAINDVGPQKIYLSAHDTCDYALARFQKELHAEVAVLKAGAVYNI